MPKNPLATLSRSGEAWEEVEKYRQQHALNAGEMGQRLGVSAGAYRGWRSRGEMPASMWQRFQALLAHELPTTPTTPRGISLPEPYWHLLKAMGEGNTSAGVRRLIDLYRTHPK